MSKPTTQPAYFLTAETGQDKDHEQEHQELDLVLLYL